MLANYLRAQYGPYLKKGATDVFEDFYVQILSIARPYVIGNTALDVGCATGRLVFEYARMGAKRSVGIDSSKSFIAFCNELKEHKRDDVEYPVSDGNILFIEGDACDTDILPEKFRFISCINLIDRVPDPTLLMSALDARLLPKGILLLADPYDWNLSPAPKSSHIENMKSLLGNGTWAILEERWVPFVVPITSKSNREYSCHVLVAKKA